MKLSRSKCHFGVKQVNFLGRTITPEGVPPQVEKVKKFFEKLKFPKSKKRIPNIHRISEKLQKLYTTTLRTTYTFFKPLKETNKFYISNDLTEVFEHFNKLLLQSCQMTQKQPIKDKQVILLSEASFTAAGHAIMMKLTQQKLQSKRKTYAPTASGSKLLKPHC